MMGFFTHVAVRCLVACAFLQPPLLLAQAPAATHWPTKEWSVSTPRAEGMDAAVLADLLDDLGTPTVPGRGGRP